MMMMMMMLLLFVSHTFVKQINPFTTYNLIPRTIIELLHTSMDMYEFVGLTWMPPVKLVVVPSINKYYF